MKILKLSQDSVRMFLAFSLVGLSSVTTVNAQNAQSPKGETINLQVVPADKTAADNKAGHHVHLLPARVPGADRHTTLSNSADTTDRVSAISGRGALAAHSSLVASVPGVPPPGYYPADLSNPANGPVVTTGRSNPVYVNCTASCWGDPETFLDHLDDSDFMHIVDQYVDSSANDRYKEGTASSISFPVFAPLTDNDILQIAHAAAKVHGTGYGHIYHIFLPKGVDVCFTGTTICYSPDNLPTFVFCAYHGSVDFKDIGHVLFSVEPFQDVTGCSITQPSPNGSLIDSTSSTLAHETIETITDPDGTAWIALNSLGVFGEEIGDLCVNPFGTEAVSILDGKAYEIQSMYSNKFHACANVP